MSEDWTVDISAKTPLDRKASNEEITKQGTVLDQPAVLVTHGSSIRLKVSGFVSEAAANDACPYLCFGLKYLGVKKSLPIRFSETPRKVFLYDNPEEAAKNISKTFGGSGTEFGSQVHGIMDEGAPAIYRSHHRIVMLSLGSPSVVTSLLGGDHKGLEDVDWGAGQASSVDELPANLETAIELFNNSGFEPSPSAEFIVLVAALEQIFPPEQVDVKTRQLIESIAESLEQQASQANDDDCQLIKDLWQRILGLKRESISKSIKHGAACILAEDKELRVSLSKEIGTIYSRRSDFAHKGEANLSTLSRLREIVQSILLVKLSELQGTGSK